MHCPGHVGHIELPLRVFHPAYFKTMLTVSVLFYITLQLCALVRVRVRVRVRVCERNLFLEQAEVHMKFQLCLFAHY